MVKRNKRGIILISLGLVLLVIASGWFLYNKREDEKAGAKAQRILEKLEKEQNKNNSKELITLDGKTYCGTIIIKKLSISLPVFNSWSYEKLQTAPCRYSGSINNNDLIIAAHNYDSHFGRLEELEIGDKVVFCDAKGFEHNFEVNSKELLDGTSIEDMKKASGLTLFTCNLSGEQRVTLRLKETK